MMAVRYPRDQMMKGQEGWVVVGYDLDGSGSAQNLRILKSSPPEVFDTAVLRTFSGIKFKPETKRENCRGFVQFRIR
jgi:TonB family protein